MHSEKETIPDSNKPKGAKPVLLAITNHSYMFWQFRRELMQAFQKDYDVVINTPFEGHEEDFKALGFTVIEQTKLNRRGLHPREDITLFRDYIKLLKQIRPAMVLTYSIKPNVYAGLACRLLRIPYCVNVQGLGTAFQYEPIASVASIMYRTACRKARKVFFENDSSAGIFLNRRIVKKNKVAILSGAGVNLDYYGYTAYTDKEKTHFLYLGRIMKEKGIGELLAAAKRLGEEFPDRFVLDMVGFFEDEYRDQVTALEQSGTVKFHGFCEDPRPYYKNTDCVVLPSYHEGMSNVLLEGAAMGRCLITSDIPGCREAVEDNVTGFLCQARDEDSLYNAMKKVLTLTRANLEEMGRKGREKVAREFNKAEVVRQTVEKVEEDNKRKKAAL